MTFFITRPPVLTTSPRPLTKRTPSRLSRAAPALMRRGPEQRWRRNTPPIVGRRVGAEQRAQVHRLERQHLAALGQRRLDLGERRAGARGDDQLAPARRA